MSDPIGRDVQGADMLTQAVMQMLLEVEPDIYFDELGDNSGICFTNDSGSLIMSEKKFITGGYERVCSYPFFIVLRSICKDEKSRLKANRRLMGIGDYMSAKESFPELTGGRKIIKIEHQNAYGTEIDEQTSVQDWIMPFTVEYEHRKDY